MRRQPAFSDYSEPRPSFPSSSRSRAAARIFHWLLPVWRVEVRSTVTDGEPYELIDRYLERGIGQAGLGTVTELADFFCLDEVVVDHAVRFLHAIGHVTMSGGKLSLTQLGRESVRDGTRYAVTRQDRRTLYFDAFGSRPLPRARGVAQEGTGSPAYPGRSAGP